jgi:hypothetical protein
MAVEIKELVIRAVAVDTGNRNSSALSTRPDESQLQLVVENCVKEVLKILERKEAR